MGFWGRGSELGRDARRVLAEGVFVHVELLVRIVLEAKEVLGRVLVRVLVFVLGAGVFLLDGLHLSDDLCVAFRLFLSLEPFLFFSFFFVLNEIVLLKDLPNNSPTVTHYRPFF